MQAAKKRRNSQNGMLLAGLAMCVYYLVVYQPLSRRAAALDQPLLELWAELARAGTHVTRPDDAQLPKLDAALESVQSARNTIERSRRAIANRIQPSLELAERIRGTFQLIEFQNERQLATEQLRRLARQNKVQLDSKLEGGFPEYFADRGQPVLLWVQLRLLQDVLQAAISCEVSLVQSVSSPPIEVDTSAPDATGRRADVSIQVELVGNAESILRFLETIPLRTDEILARGLPPAAAGKPAYFIDKLLIRKESQDRPDEVRVQARIRSFVELNHA